MLTPADDEAGEKEKHEKDAPDDAHDDVEHRRPASGFTPDVSSFPPDRQGQDAGLVGVTGRLTSGGKPLTSGGNPESGRWCSRRRVLY